MSNGFKKAVGLLVSASLLASLAATAFAGTAAAAATNVPTAINVAGDEAYTPLTSNVITFNGIDDIYAPIAGASLRFHVGNGFELGPASITATVVQGGGGLLLGAVGPGQLTETVPTFTTASGSYFDLHIWRSSGDCSVTNCTLTISGGAVRQRDGAAAAGDVVDINHNATDPGVAFMQAVTIYTLTGTVGGSTFHITVSPPSFSADTVNPQATATAVSDGFDWAGNAAAAVTAVGSWTAECANIAAATPLTATITDCHDADTWDVTATATAPAASVGIVGTGSFTVYPGVLASITVQDVDGFTSGDIPVGETRQFVAICYDAWGNEIDRTWDNGYRPFDCYGTWSDSPHPGAADVNFTGLLSANRQGRVDAVIYTIGAISGSSGPWDIVAGPYNIWFGQAIPTTPFNQASPIIRAAGYGATTAAYSYTEPEWIFPTTILPHVSGAVLFPLSGFTWTIDIADHQGNRRVHFDTSAGAVDGPGSLDLGCGGLSYLNDYTLQVVACSSNPFQIEQISITGLKVKADADAALGTIMTRYGLDTSRFTFGGNGGPLAFGRLFPNPVAKGATSFQVLYGSGSDPFEQTSAFAGPLHFTDSLDVASVFDGLSTDTVNVNSSSADVGITTLNTSATGKAHDAWTYVWQQLVGDYSCEQVLPNPARIHNYGRCALPSIGTVLDSLKLTANTAMVQRGLPNRLPFGQLHLDERTTGAEGNGSSAGLLAGGTVINLTLPATAGVVFSEPPTAKVTWTKAAATGDIATRDGFCYLSHILAGALYVPFCKYSADLGSAKFGVTGAARGNLFFNSDPWSFENRKVVGIQQDLLGGSGEMEVAPSTWHCHNDTLQVDCDNYAWLGQDVFGAAVGDLGLSQAPLTLYNPNNGTYPTLVDPLNYNNTVYVADLSSDRLTASFKVRTADVGWVTSRINIDGFLDVSASATAGSSVDITVSTATGSAANKAAADSTIPVIGSPVTVGYVNNTVDGTAQAVPSVIIGANDQATGTVVIREAASGMLGAGVLVQDGVRRLTNVLRVCYVSNTGKPEIFTRAPWLVVTNGDLKLRANSDPSIPSGAAAPSTGVRGYIGGASLVGGTYGANCAQWIVSNASTTASTLEIRGSASDGTMLASGPNNGPHVNVDPQQKPGPVTLSLWQIPFDWFSFGSVPASATEFDLVQNAVRVFGANVAVAAVSQPELKKGGLNQPAGDVTITESATFQLGNYSWWLGGVQQAIWFQIVPNNARDMLPSVYFNTDRVVPVVSTNSSESGLIAHFGRWYGNKTFSVVTDQRAFVPVAGSWVPGKITVSGLQYSVTNDAALGPVQLQVCSTGSMQVSSPSDFSVCPGVQAAPYFSWSAENPANFNQTVSNAKVVEQSSILGAIAPGVAGPGSNKWRFNTVLVEKGKYVTLRLQAVKGAVVGDRIEIWGRAGKTGTWKKLTTRTVGANGYIFYFKKISGYTEFQALFAGSDTAAASYAVPRYYRASVGTAKQVAAWNKAHAN